MPVIRPPDARQISMARSRAQSECGELSTGTKTSLYGMTPPSAVMGSLNGYSELLGFFSADHQSRRFATAPAHLHPSTRSRLHRATLHLPKRALARRARYERVRFACQGHTSVIPSEARNLLLTPSCEARSTRVLLLASTFSAVDATVGRAVSVASPNVAESRSRGIVRHYSWA